MEIPEELVLDDGSNFAFARNGAAVGLAFLVFVCGVAVVLYGASPSALALPVASLSVFWLAWVGINLAFGAIHRTGDRRAIERLFLGEVWGQWQYRAADWQRAVEAEYRVMCPEEGPGAYVGAVYSSVAGLVIAAILVAVGKYAIRDPGAMPAVWVSASAAFLVLLGVGLFQPVHNRLEARRYRRRALRLAEPRVWFAADGFYHETMGYTSLKELVRVTDQTRARSAISFSIQVTTVFGGSGHASSSTHLQDVSVPVPSGCERDAARLVRRYRQERL